MVPADTPIPSAIRVIILLGDLIDMMYGAPRSLQPAKVCLSVYSVAKEGWFFLSFAWRCRSLVAAAVLRCSTCSWVRTTTSYDINREDARRERGGRGRAGKGSVVQHGRGLLSGLIRLGWGLDGWERALLSFIVGVSFSDSDGGHDRVGVGYT